MGDLDIVKWFIQSGQELRFPEVIPFKENLCTVLGELYLNNRVNEFTSKLTVTDVLRIAIHMSGGNISLPKVPYKFTRVNSWSTHKAENPARELFKFKKFSRPERKLILSFLEQTNCDATEAVLKDQRWIRLGEILHPGEYQNQFPRAFKMFDVIRNTKVVSWYGKVNAGFKKSFKNGLIILSERPGEFLRRLDYLVRSNEGAKREAVLSILEEVVTKVSNKVLFESYIHFEGRNVPKTNRTIMIKGSRKITELPDLVAIDTKVIERIQTIIRDGLKYKFHKLPKLKKVWVDEELKNIPLPSNMRSMNSALKPRVRGIRIPIGNQNAKVVRAFVHWFDERGNRDIDLTATFIGMGKVKRIGWNGEDNAKEGCYSGDIRHRQGACAEYIDVNIKETLKNGYKYVILDARNYNGGTLAEITDCVAGFMEREFPKAGEIFVPAMLSNTVRLTSDSSNTIVTMIDVETQEYIFLDIDADGIPVASANFDEIMKAVKPYMEPPKFSVYDLIRLHVDARGGVMVEPSKDKVVTNFTFEAFADSYVETLKLMGV